MFQLLLFFGTICILFFLPVQFYIHFDYQNWKSTVILELSFLQGKLNRKKEIYIDASGKESLHKETINSEKWFWIKKKRKPRRNPQAEKLGFTELLKRYDRVGLAALLVFLPDRYYRWLRVAGNLESKGQFQHLQWYTRVGMDDAAVTATLSGLLWGFKTMALTYLENRYWFKHPPQIAVEPDFDTPGTNTVFDCIFRVKLGYIIIAAFIAELRHLWKKEVLENE